MMEYDVPWTWGSTGGASGSKCWSVNSDIINGMERKADEWGGEGDTVQGVPYNINSVATVRCDPARIHLQNRGASSRHQSIIHQRESKPNPTAVEQFSESEAGLSLPNRPDMA